MMDTNYSLLIVDDDVEIAKVLAMTFEMEGVDVEVVFSGAEALEKLKERSFDGVFSDLQMPNMNGLELWEKIQQELDEPPLFFLATGYNTIGEEEKERLNIAGIFDKPYEMDKILMGINSFFS